MARIYAQLKDCEIILLFQSGDSANAVPHYQKLRTRVTHIWGDRGIQPNRKVQWSGLGPEEPPK